MHSHVFWEVMDIGPDRQSQRLTTATLIGPIAAKLLISAMPAFESLTTTEGSRAFPIQLEPFSCTRFEMADFARWAQRAGIRYIGICCGGGPHHVRAMAEALGRDTPASRYSPAIDLHPVVGTSTAEHAEMGGWVAQR